MDYAKYLLELSKEHDIPMAKVCQAGGVAYSTWWRMATGKTRPNADTLIALIGGLSAIALHRMREAELANDQN